MQHVFLIGSKSVGAYGGFETFVNKLTEYHKNDERIKYHIACKANGTGAAVPKEAKIIDEFHFQYNNADCFQIRIPEKIGSAQSIWYDCVALTETINIIKNEKIENAIVYIMACRIGPFFKEYVKQIHELGGKVFLNPDGHEWKRAKWSLPIKKYWKYSEKLMVKQADLVICDSVNIEKYIKETYGQNIKTTYIAYGAETRDSIYADDKFNNWIKEKDIKENEYYLVVGRFVPENNYETMLREFIQSNSKRDFVLVTSENEPFLKRLDQKIGLRNDKRIKFVGTVYDQELLKKIREKAFAYLHGHEVGGTNPSLIEALGSTKVNLLLDTNFNKEVALENALYWNKEEGNLSLLINRVDLMNEEERSILGEKAKERVKTAYSWKFICDRYAEEFLR